MINAFNISSVFPIFRFTERKDRWISFLLSLVMHGVLLFGAGSALVQGAQYGVEQGFGGVEITLVAAPPAFESLEAERTTPSIVSDITSMESEFDMLAENSPLKSKASQKKEGLKTSVHNQSDEMGDGSSPVVGKDSTTFYASGGASTETKPGYLKNPAPPYPPKALEARQEGIVILSLVVDRGGNARNVAIKESSGFLLLDQSALNTVRHWSFLPARIGSVPQESQVEIPVRFEIEEYLKRKSG